MATDNSDRPVTVTTVDPQNGQFISVVGDTYRIIMTGGETQGAFAAIDMMVPPNGGPGPHAHAEFQETFFVLEGEVVVRSETQKYVAKKGAFVRVPKGGAIHSFKNETDVVARVLCIVVPAGLEGFFEEIGKPVQPGSFLPPPQMTPDAMKQMQDIAKRYGQEVFPPDTLKK